jgi:hypothetical protein
MQKWEYLLEMFDRWLFAEELQGYGNEGWELVAVIRPEPDKAHYLYYFKLPKK